MPRFFLPSVLVIGLWVSGCADRLTIGPAPGRFEVTTPRTVGHASPASFVVASPELPRMERLPPVGPLHDRIGSMTLMHAIGMALRNSDIVRVSEGSSVSADPRTAYDVGTSDARVLAALAEFDTSWASTFYTSSSKQPPNAFFGPGLTPLPTERDEAALRLGVNKRWQTGAQTSVMFNSDPTYLYVPYTVTVRCEVCRLVVALGATRSTTA